MWMRVARRHPLACLRQPLSKRRIHDGQYTQRFPSVALAEQSGLLRPVLESPTYPLDVRRAVADYLLGQQRQWSAALLRHGETSAGIRATLGELRYGRPLLMSLATRAGVFPAAKRLVRACRAARRRVRAAARIAINPSVTTVTESRPTDIWIDGSVLDQAQAGHFTFTVQLIRSLVRQHDRTCRVHVRTTPKGAAALHARLGGDAAAVRIHAGPAQWAARAAATRLGLARSSSNTIEVVIWRGRFAWRHSRKIAIVPDLTTRLYPELHTPGNIKDFERFASYAVHHADTIATISEHSRRDIIDNLPVCPAAVHVMPVSIDPVFLDERFDPMVPARYDLRGPYVLSVGTVEPRKNLGRLISAFERTRNEPLQLALVGAQGWDAALAGRVEVSPARDRVTRLGFVPLEHLPSLYRLASAVVYPSLYEGFGLPVLEAMACSAIVVASRTSSMPEVLGPGGVFVDPYEVGDIASALDRVLNWSDAEATGYRRACRARAEAFLQAGAARPVLPGLAVASDREPESDPTCE